MKIIKQCLVSTNKLLYKYEDVKAIFSSNFADESMDKEQNSSDESDANNMVLKSSNDEFSLDSFHTDAIENKGKTVFKCEQCSKESVKLFKEVQ